MSTDKIAIAYCLDSESSCEVNNNPISSSSNSSSSSYSSSSTMIIIIICIIISKCCYGFSYTSLIVTMGISPMGNDGRYPQGKPAATECV